jgi:hypothetical protein
LTNGHSLHSVEGTTSVIKNFEVVLQLDPTLSQSIGCTCLFTTTVHHFIISGVHKN